MPIILTPSQQGVIVGYSQLSTLSVYDLQKDQRLHFRKHYKFNVPNFYRVVSLHVGVEDAYIAIVV